MVLTSVLWGCLINILLTTTDTMLFDVSVCGLLSYVIKDRVSELCLDQLTVLCRNPALLWKMFDASSKFPPSGFTYGRIMDFGNFPECMSIRYEHGSIRVLGKHCPLSIAIPKPFTNHNNSVDQSLMFKFILPNPNITFYSVCIPDRCTVNELIHLVVPWFRNDSQRVSHAIQCQTADTNTVLDTKAIIFIVCLTVIGMVIMLATVYELLAHRMGIAAKKSQIIAFSLVSNCHKLFHILTTKDNNQISCLHGIRAISILWIIAGHGFGVWLPTIGVLNLDYGLRWRQSLRAQYVYSAHIAVDTFFFISGLVLSYNYMDVTKNMGTVSLIKQLPKMYLLRYCRLTPALVILWLAYLTIFRYLGSGPLWTIMSEAFQCGTHWWKMLLYIQNYQSTTKICLVHTWYLSADMQMFLLSPIVLIPLSAFRMKHLSISISAVGVLIAALTALPMAIRFVDTSYENDFDTHSRLSVYVIGILLGAILRLKQGHKFPFGKVTNICTWIITLSFCLAFNIYFNDVINHYTHTKHTLFYGLYRPLWALCLAWFVYSCHSGYGGVVNSFLSLPGFVILSRLSYCMYLTHMFVMLYWLGSQQSTRLFSDYFVFYTYCGHLVVTVAVSIIWSLAFESPIIALTRWSSMPARRNNSYMPRAVENTVS